MQGSLCAVKSTGSLQVCKSRQSVHVSRLAAWQEDVIYLNGCAIGLFRTRKLAPVNGCSVGNGSTAEVDSLNVVTLYAADGSQNGIGQRTCNNQRSSGGAYR